MLPKGSRGVELYRRNFRAMAAKYPPAPATQRNLLELEADYAKALDERVASGGGDPSQLVGDRMER